MPENFTNIMLFILFGGIGALALIRIIIKQIQNRFAPIKTVRATVINKQKNQTTNLHSIKISKNKQNKKKNKNKIK